MTSIPAVLCSERSSTIVIFSIVRVPIFCRRLKHGGQIAPTSEIVLLQVEASSFLDNLLAVVTWRNTTCKLSSLRGVSISMEKDVIKMRLYQDMSFKEISDNTGVSINTALGRMRYGLINLRKMIDKHNINLIND